MKSSGGMKKAGMKNTYQTYVNTSIPSHVYHLVDLLSALPFDSTD
jgi:hypothetical protein